MVVVGVSGVWGADVAPAFVSSAIRALYLLYASSPQFHDLSSSSLLPVPEIFVLPLSAYLEMLLIHIQVPSLLSFPCTFP